MAINLSKLSNTDLMALKNKDFKSISDEGLRILKPPSPEEKFQKQKQIVSQITPQSPVGVPGGVATVPIPGTLEQAKAGPFENMRVVGEKIAEGLASGPLQTHPSIAAAIGTAFQLSSDMPLALIPGGGVKVVKAGGKVLKATGSAIKQSKLGKAIRHTGQESVLEAEKLLAERSIQETRQLGKLATAKEKVVSATERIAQEVKQRAEAPVRKIREAIKGLPVHAEKLLKQADDRLAAAKTLINDAEQSIGLGLKDVGTKQFGHLIDTPKKVRKFAIKYFEVANRIGEKTLAEALDPKTLQTVRKAAENAAKDIKNVAVKNELFGIEKTFRNAIARSHKIVGDAVNEFRLASKAVNKLPETFKSTKNTLSLSLQRLQNLSKEKLLTDPKLKQYQKTLEILERKAKELPRQFANEKAQIDLVIREGKNLAARQIRTRWVAGGAAVGAAISLFGRKALTFVSGGGN